MSFLDLYAYHSRPAGILSTGLFVFLGIFFWDKANPLFLIRRNRFDFVLWSGSILSRGVKKGVKAAVATLIGLLTSVKVAMVLQGLGVTVDMVKLETGATVMVTGAVATALNWAKVRLKPEWL